MSLTEKVYNKILQARRPKLKLRYSSTPLNGMSLYGTFVLGNFNMDNTTIDRVARELNENNKTGSNRNN